MKKETDLSEMAAAMSRDMEKPMDPSVQQTTQDPQQWYGPNNDGQFGPMAPLSPFPLGGDPRQFQYRPAWNLPTSPRSDRPVDVDLLRQLADTYDLLRKCIEIRKYEICSLDWDIVPIDKNKRKSKEIREKRAALIDEIKAVFMYPEAYLEETEGGFLRKPIRTFDEWLSALLEDYFVIDALTIYPRPKRNGELLALERIDGATIKPLLTIDGRVPIPPAPAYQQYLYGMPRASFTLKQLYYKPRNVRNNTPYGFSHVEQALIHINFALRSQMWYSAYFTHGSIPEGLLTFPENWTPDQVWGFIDRINQMVSGNPAALRQFLPAPAGGGWINLKEFDMNDSLISYIVTMTCAIMDIQPMEIGFMPQHGGSGLGGKGFADAQNLIHNRKSLLPLARWLEAIFTQIIHDWWGHQGANDLEFAFTTLRDIEDTERDKMDIEMVKTGLKSIDEVVMERGGEPPGIGRIFVAGSNVLFEPDLIAGTQGGASSIAPSNEQPEPRGPTGATAESTPNENDEPKQKEISAGLEKLVRALLIKSSDDDSSDDDSDFDAWFLTFMAAVAGRIRRGNIGVTKRDIDALTGELFSLMKGAYINGLNDQLQNLGLDPVDDISDPDILARLEKAAKDTAAGIMDTLATDIENQIGKLEAQGMKGKELAEALAQWLEDRAGWKAQQISATEANRAFTNAAADFMKNNGLHRDAEFWVEPDKCKCDECQELVDNNPYHGVDGLNVLDMLPLHPNCIHRVTIKYGDSANEIHPENLWMG